MLDSGKKILQRITQKLLGFDNYLFLFSLFIQSTLKWNPKEGHFRHFMNMLSEGDQVIDIGANIGIMSSLLAKKCRKGRIFAVEPIPENIKALNRMLQFRRAENVVVLPVALGESSGNLEMRMPIIEGVRMQGLSHVYHPDIEGYEAPYRSYQVPLKSLDELFPTEQIDAIKMDVENFEIHVLKGAANLIDRCKPLIYIELWDNENRTACMEFLKGKGYIAQVWERGAIQPFDSRIHRQHNFFFTQP